MPFIKRLSDKFNRAEKPASVIGASSDALLSTEARRQDIFDCIIRDDIEGVLALVEADPHELERRDDVGAAPIHLAFLQSKDDIGKELVTRYPSCAMLTYVPPENTPVGPYDGENILHISIIRQVLFDGMPFCLVLPRTCNAQWHPLVKRGPSSLQGG